MLTSNLIKKNIEWFFEKTISSWYQKQMEKYGMLKELLEEPSFCSMVGLTPFSARRITDDDLNNFLTKYREKTTKKQEYTQKVNEIEEYMNEGETEIRLSEVKQIIKDSLSKNLKYIEKINVNILWNNIENPNYSKRYWAYIKAKQFTKSDDDVEYNPQIIINKSISLVDLEKIKEQNYKVLEEEDFFAANDITNEKPKTKKGKKKDEANSK